MSDSLLRDADPNYLLNVIRAMDARLQAVERSFVYANNVDEAFGSLGLAATFPGVTLDENGLQLLNGAYSENGGSYMRDLGWNINQLAVANARTFGLQVGQRDNGVTAESALRTYEKLSDVDIINYDFSYNDMTGFTSKVNPYDVNTRVALTTLSSSFVVSGIAVDSAGNIFVSISSGATGSGVWKYTLNTATWAAHGTLSTATAINCIVIDDSDNIYVGSTGLATSRLWKCPSGSTTWAAFGTFTSGTINTLFFDVTYATLYLGLSAGVTSSVWKCVISTVTYSAVGTLSVAFSVKGLALDTTTARLFAVGNAFTTSCCWECDLSGPTWSARGTLNPAAAAQCVVRDAANNVYVGTNAGLSTSAVYVSYYGTTTFVPLGTLNTASNVQSLVTLGDETIIAIGNIAGKVAYVWNGAAWVDSGHGNSTDTIGFIDSSGNIYTRSGSATSVVKLTPNAWSGASGAGVAINTSSVVPEIQTALFSVTPGQFINMFLSHYVNVASGSVIVSGGVRFYDSNNPLGKRLVSTVRAFSRTVTADVPMVEYDGDCMVPAGATYACIFGSFYNASGAVLSTVGFDRFKAQVLASIKEIIVDKFAALNFMGQRYSFPVILYKNTTPPTVNVTGAFTVKAFDVTVPGGVLSNNAGLRFDIRFFMDLNALSRQLTINLHYGSTVVATIPATGYPAAGLLTYHLIGNLFATGTNAQRGYVELFYTNTTSTSLLNHWIREGVGAEVASADKNIKLELVVNGSVDAFNVYDTTVILEPTN